MPYNVGGDVTLRRDSSEGAPDSVLRVPDHFSIEMNGERYAWILNDSERMRV